MPAATADNELRATIAQHVAEQIPEQLDDTEWDFKKEAFPTSKEDKVIVFAPVKAVYHPVKEAAEAVGMTIEAVEPISIASKRHADPMIGTTLKTDLAGTDEHVLNIAPAAHKRRWRPTRTHLLILGAIIALIAIGVTAAFFLMPAPEPAAPTPPPPEDIMETDPQEEATSAATVEEPIEINPADYSIQVLNGSGIAGEAGKIQGRLIADGFEEVDTDNADAFDAVETVIQLNEGIPEELYERIEPLLEEYTVVRGDQLTDDNPYDVIITVGT